MTSKDLQALGLISDEDMNTYLNQYTTKYTKEIIGATRTQNPINLEKLDDETLIKFMKKKIEDDELELEYNVMQLEQIIKEMRQKITSQTEALELFKTKDFKGIKEEIIASFPKYDEVKNFKTSNSLPFELSNENIEILRRYFEMKLNRSKVNYEMIFPEEIYPLFISGKSPKVRFNSKIDVQRFKQILNQEYRKFNNERSKYDNEFNYERMMLYLLENKVDITEIIPFIKYHGNKIDSSLREEIEDYVSEIQNIIENTTFISTRRKKGEIAQLCKQLIKPLMEAVNQVKTWYKENLYNETLGISKDDAVISKNESNIIENPQHVSLLRDKITKREQQLKDLEYELDVIYRKLELNDEKYDQIEHFLIQALILDEDNNLTLDQIKDFVDKCYQFSRYYIEDGFLVTYQECNMLEFLNIVSSLARDKSVSKIKQKNRNPK